METKLSRFLVLVAALAFLDLASFGKADVIAWDNVPWVNNGITTQSLDLNGDSIADLRVAVTGSVLGSTPLNTTSPYTGGLFPQKALQLWTSSAPGGMNVTVTFLPGGLYDMGVQNLTYSLFDVDGNGLAGSGTDIISGSSATLVGGGTEAPATMTATAPFNAITGPDSATGLAIANDNSAEGTVTTTYGNAAISSFVFHYDNAISPANGIALGDISFTPVPEAGTVAACAVFSLLGAWGLRRMRKAQPSPLEA